MNINEKIQDTISKNDCLISKRNSRHASVWFFHGCLQCLETLGSTI